jgi:uncharacterized protein (TIGR04540 family)
MMEYKNANDVAKAVRDIIDNYWMKSISEENSIRLIEAIVAISKNRARIFRGKKYTAVFENILGKRRLEEFDRFYNIIDKHISS